MADDRPVESIEEMVARLAREVADLRSTALVRASRRPTGTVEEWPWPGAPPADTLLLHGQTVNRADFPVLWQVVQDRGGVTSGLFTSGNGTTTFGLPDRRGLVARGVAASGEVVGQVTGADTKTITTSNMPGHDHNVSGSLSASTGSAGSHDHGFSTNTTGSHGGHVAGGSSPNADGALQSNYTTSYGAHSHSGTTDTESSHTHSVTGSVSISESSVGSGSVFDVRQAAKATHWIIWT